MRFTILTMPLVAVMAVLSVLNVGCSQPLDQQQMIVREDLKHAADDLVKDVTEFATKDYVAVEDARRTFDDKEADTVMNTWIAGNTVNGKFSCEAKDLLATMQARDARLRLNVQTHEKNLQARDKVLGNLAKSAVMFQKWYSGEYDIEEKKRSAAAAVNTGLTAFTSAGGMAALFLALGI